MLIWVPTILFCGKLRIHFSNIGNVFPGAHHEYKHREFVIRDLQNEKRDHSHLLHSPHSEVEGVRIDVISFLNNAENQVQNLDIII